jgi:AcrR family transcriptional regulator
VTLAYSYTKEKLANGFVGLLEFHPLSEITVRDITAAGHVTRQVFYRYFHTRDDLIRWMYNKSFADVFKEHDVLWWDEITVRMLMALYENRTLYQRIARYSGDDTLERIMNEYTLAFYSKMVKYITGSAPDYSTSILLQIYVTGGINIAVDWIRSGMNRAPKDMCTLFRAAMPPLVADILTSSAVPVNEILPL